MHILGDSQTPMFPAAGDFWPIQVPELMSTYFHTDTKTVKISNPPIHKNRAYSYHYPDHMDP